jgi:hypothetical protein
VCRAYPSSRPLRLDELPMPAQPSPLGELEAQTPLTFCKSRAPDVCDPCGADSAALCGRPVSTSVHESHGCAPGECCAADRYAS